MKKIRFGPDDFTIIDRKAAFQGFFRLDVVELQHRLFAGGWSDTLQREIFVRNPVAGVLLFDPLLDKVVLVEQFRLGAIHQTESPWLIELVAGILEKKDESLMALAQREAEEEAGCHITQLVPIHRYFSSPGGSTEEVNLFCGHVDASQVGGLHGLAEECEDIRVLVIDTNEAFAMVDDGRINNAATIIALQWLRLQQAQQQPIFT